MTLDVTRETIINASRERVWAYLVDFGRHPEWADPTHNLRIQPPQDVRTGATFTSVGKDMGRDTKNAVVITEVVSGQRLAFEATHDHGAQWRNTYELSDAPGGTRIAKRETFISARFPRNMILAVIGPLMKGEAAKICDADLARFKARIERAPLAVAS